MKKWLAIGIVCGLMLVLAGCSSDGSQTANATALPDAGIPDAAPPDAALPDSGSSEGGGMDSGATDGGGMDGGHACPSRFATRVVDFQPGPASKGDTSVVLGPPRGGGATQGSLDVLSLGNGGSITLAFDPSSIVDGPGADFIVFENPFYIGGDPTMVFAELATVSVSEDGQTFHDFPCTASAPPYGDCAGWHPVYANADTNTIDPTDPAVAGGDPFDLAELGLTSARFVRITDRVDLTGTAGVFDLDAVSIVHAACP